MAKTPLCLSMPLPSALSCQVVFDRFDKRETGSLSAADTRSALEYMGRDVSGEACASWLADREKQNGGGISFVDFTMA